MRCSNCDTKVNRRDWMNQAELCAPCYDYAGWENTHDDEAHDEDGERHPGCPICYEDEVATADAIIAAEDQTASTARSHAPCYEQGLHRKNREGRAYCRQQRAKGQPL